MRHSTTMSRRVGGRIPFLWACAETQTPAASGGLHRFRWTRARVLRYSRGGVTPCCPVQDAQPAHARAVRRSAWPAAVAALCWFGASAQAADAVDFRVLTSVTTENAGQPLFSTLTIFQGRLVYDFLLDDSRQVTIFDASREQFTLLDGQHRLQCRLTGQELLRLIAAIRLRDQRAGDGHERLAADPAFRESYDPDLLRVELAASDGAVTYVAVGQRPMQTWAVDAYGQFADWFARLNATRDGRSPEARLRLNEAISKRSLLPVNILRRRPWTAGLRQPARVSMVAPTAGPGAHRHGEKMVRGVPPRHAGPIAAAASRGIPVQTAAVACRHATS